MNLVVDCFRFGWAFPPTLQSPVYENLESPGPKVSTAKTRFSAVGTKIGKALFQDLRGTNPKVHSRDRVNKGFVKTLLPRSFRKSLKILMTKISQRNAKDPY